MPLRAFTEPWVIVMASRPRSAPPPPPVVSASTGVAAARARANGRTIPASLLRVRIRVSPLLCDGRNPTVTADDAPDRHSFRPLRLTCRPVKLVRPRNQTRQLL